MTSIGSPATRGTRSSSRRGGGTPPPPPSPSLPAGVATTVTVRDRSDRRPLLTRHTRRVISTTRSPVTASTPPAEPSPSRRAASPLHAPVVVSPSPRVSIQLGLPLPAGAARAGRAARAARPRLRRAAHAHVVRGSRRPRLCADGRVPARLLPAAPGLAPHGTHDRMTGHATQRAALRRNVTMAAVFFHRRRELPEILCCCLCCLCAVAARLPILPGRALRDVGAAAGAGRPHGPVVL